MGAVFAGFGTITAIILLGILLAHLRIVDVHGQRTLSALAFYVASPALLVTVLEDSDVGAIFSGTLVATVGGVFAVGLVAVVLARLRGADLGSTVISAMCAGYVNAGNLGLPIAAYVLDDAAHVVPQLLLQLLVLQPLALTVLDAAVAPGRLTVIDVLTRPLKNPITIASALGLVLALADVTIPRPVHDPLELIAGMAVPSMLLAYGISLRLGPLPGRGVPAVELGAAVVLKMVVHPLATYAVGRFLLGLDQDALFAVTVIASLPTAQNVFVIASRYRQAELLARDAIFVSTLSSLPVVLGISVLLA